MLKGKDQIEHLILYFKITLMPVFKIFDRVRF